MFNDWTKNQFWQKRKGNGLWKVQFFQINTKGKEKTHAIYERPREAVEMLIETMQKWGNDKKRIQKGFRLFNDQLECWQEVFY